MQTRVNETTDREAIALSACYRILLKKAQERRERLAKTAVKQMDSQLKDSQNENMPEGR